jgi:hypothetical protein
MATQPVDVFDSADNPQLKTGPQDYFGQVRMDMFFCILKKGIGKQPFDASQHSPDDRRTAVDINIYPLAEQNISYDVTRNMIVESREWAAIVLPTIKNLGISTRDLNNKWTHVRTKGTGATYTNKNGDQVERTTFEFVALFDTEAACRTAYQAWAAGSPTPAPAAAPAPNGNGAGDAGKQTAAKFAKVIVENACKGQTDLGVITRTIAANIAAMAPVAKYFTADSPEIQTMVFEAMSK